MPLTVVPATAVIGTFTVVDTSARPETAVVADALSGAAFAPWAVVVPIELDTVTEADAGAVYVKPMAIVDDAPRAVGIPVNVTAPEPALYEAVAPPGRPAKPTPDNPGASPSV